MATGLRQHEQYALDNGNVNKTLDDDDSGDGLKAQLSKTRITESPRRNLQNDLLVNATFCASRFGTYILLTKRSLFTPLPPFVFGFSVHISLTFSRTILQCLSKALTRASSFLLLRQEMRT